MKAGGENSVSRACIKCAECCLSCFEKIVDYVNKSAYAYMAITGEGFCKSAWHAFLLQMKHGLAFVFAKFLAECFILVGKIGLTLANMGFLYALMKYAFKDYEGNDAITSSTGPFLIVALVTYLCASVFLSLFDETALALLTCVSFDTDLHDGVAKYGPPTFHDGMDKVK